MQHYSTNDGKSNANSCSSFFLSNGIPSDSCSGKVAFRIPSRVGSMLFKFSSLIRMSASSLAIAPSRLLRCSANLIPKHHTSASTWKRVGLLFSLFQFRFQSSEHSLMFINLGRKKETRNTFVWCNLSKLTGISLAENTSSSLIRSISSCCDLKNEKTDIYFPKYIQPTYLNSKQLVISFLKCIASYIKFCSWRWRSSTPNFCYIHHCNYCISLFTKYIILHTSWVCSRVSLQYICESRLSFFRVTKWTSPFCLWSSISVSA